MLYEVITAVTADEHHAVLEDLLALGRIAHGHDARAGQGDATRRLVAGHLEAQVEALLDGLRKLFGRALDELV